VNKMNDNRKVTETSDYWVYYLELSNYNNGNLIGRFFDLDGVTEKDHIEEVSDWLESFGRNYEEVIVGDSDGVPEEYVSEWGVHNDFFEINELLIEEPYLSRGIIEAGVKCGVPLKSIYDAYVGEYCSDEEFAEEFAKDTGLLEGLPQIILDCISFELLSYEIMHDYDSHNDFYFRNDY